MNIVMLFVDVVQFTVLFYGTLFAFGDEVVNCLKTKLMDVVCLSLSAARDNK